MTSLLELLNVQVNNPKLNTGSVKLDRLLGGGISRGKITELTGEAGAGKTQIIIQLAVSLAAEGYLAVILDTEGSIYPQRILQIIQSNELSADVMDRIIIKRIVDNNQLLSTVQLLPALIDIKKNVGGIFVDSIAQPYRFNQNQDSRRKNGGYLYRICGILNKLASENDIPVVLTNPVSVKINQGTASQLIPALGESWSYAPSIRVFLKHKKYQGEEDEPGAREATLVKSSGNPTGASTTLPFFIKTSGICDA